MKKGSIFIILFAVIGFNVTAQEKTTVDQSVVEISEPDYDFIRKNISDKKSSLYYPKLASRFAKADTTMSLVDLQAFYYGQVWQPDFNPYRQDPRIDQVLAILRDSLSTDKDLKRGIELADKVIKTHPAEPMAYFYKFYCCMGMMRYNSDTTMLSMTKEQFNMLLYPIVASGTGMNLDSAIHVVNFHHEYLMLDLYDLQMYQQSLNFYKNHPFDILYAIGPDGDSVTVSFRIDHIYGWWSREKEKIEATVVDKPVTSLTLNVGTKFEIEVVKAKSRNSKFRLVSTEPVSDTIIVSQLKLDDSVPSNYIVGYFCYSRLNEDSEKVAVSLLFKSNHPKICSYETSVKYGDGEYEPTSNGGIFKGCLHNEIWDSSATSVRLENLATKCQR